MQQGAEMPRDELPEDTQVRRGGDRETDVARSAVDAWVQRIMLALVGLLFTIGSAYVAWTIPTINSINTTVQLSGADQSYTKREIAKLVEANAKVKEAVDTLTLQSFSWATKDQMQSARELLLQRIDAVQAEVTDLKIKVTRMEAEGKPARR